MGSFRFEYEQNGNTQTFPFDGETVTIGRAQSQDFVLDHPTVSREHAVIVDDGGGQFRLVVLSEGGMTAVDGQRVQGETRLYDGSQLYFGKLQFRFRSEQAPATQGGGQNRGGHSAGPGTHRGGAGGASGGPNRRAQQGQAASQGASARQGKAASPGQSSGGSGSMGAAGQSGQQPSASASSSGNFATASPQDANQQEDAAAAAGITSWDEIAESAGEDDQEQQEDQHQEGRQSLADNLKSGRSPGTADDGPEETNPALVAVAGVAIAGLLYFILFSGSGGGGGGGGPAESGLKGPAVKIEVECLAKPECLQAAETSYRVGKANLKANLGGGGQPGGLFEAYKKLKEAEAYLKRAKVEEPPSDMGDLDNKIKEAREALDAIFKNYQVSYTNGKKNRRYEQMARALKSIKQYFGKTSREYRWAQKRVNVMKQRGDWPYGY